MERTVRYLRHLAFVAIVVLASGCCPVCERGTAISRHVLTARATGAQVAPPSIAMGPESLSIAYLAQDYLTRDMVAGGDRVAGYKVAFTSAGARKAFGAPGPAYGRIFAGQHRDSGSAMSVREFHKVSVEMEIAMVIGRRIDRPIKTIEQLKPYVRTVCPALELPNQHFSPDAGRARFEDLVADNLGCHRFVLGPAVAPNKVELARVVATLNRDGKPVSSGRAGDVMGSPWASLLWLVNGLAATDIKLQPGDVVLTGALAGPYSPPLATAAGTYVGDFGPLGSVSCRITLVKPKIMINEEAERNEKLYVEEPRLP